MREASNPGRGGLAAGAFGTLIFLSTLGLAAEQYRPSAPSLTIAALDATKASTAFANLASQGILPVQRSLQSPMTQGEFVLALQRILNLPESNEATPFTDVAPNSPLGSALRAVGPYLGRQILCPGCALGTNFLPDQPISNLIATFVTTRALIAQKKLQLLTPAEVDSTLAKVTDSGTLPQRSKVYFATGIEAGVVSLGLDKKIGPVHDQTIGDAAILLDYVQRKFAVSKPQQ